jgi:hypothetical protein
MHPDDRPANIAELRTQLLAPGLLSRAAARVFEREWKVAQAVRDNRALLAMLGVLLLAATAITARPQMLPQSPAPSPSPTATSMATGTATSNPTPSPLPRPTGTPAPTNTPFAP